MKCKLALAKARKVQINGNIFIGDGHMLSSLANKERVTHFDNINGQKVRIWEVSD